MTIIATLTIFLLSAYFYIKLKQRNYATQLSTQSAIPLIVSRTV